MQTLRIVRRAVTDPDAERLIAQVQQVYVQLYGTPDESPFEQGCFEAPVGAFFVGYLGDEPVSTGGWRSRPDLAPTLGVASPAEIKRMFVVPAHQRRGLARSMLRHLELSAARAGASDLVLETGRPQRAAVALYTAGGYTPVIPFGHYGQAPEVVCLAKSLRQPPQRPGPDVEPRP